jgi:hypothetical protein
MVYLVTVGLVVSPTVGYRLTSSSSASAFASFPFLPRKINIVPLRTDTGIVRQYDISTRNYLSLAIRVLYV